MDSADTDQGSRGDAALQQPRYGAHGIWPTVLYTFVVMVFLWRLKMSYCILAGHLDGTPVSKHVAIWVLRPPPPSASPPARALADTGSRGPRAHETLMPRARLTSGQEPPHSRFFTTRDTPSTVAFAT